MAVHDRANLPADAAVDAPVVPVPATPVKALAKRKKSLSPSLSPVPTRPLLPRKADGKVWKLIYS
jgi:hypothetical protein